MRPERMERDNSRDNTVADEPQNLSFDGASTLVSNTSSSDDDRCNIEAALKARKSCPRCRVPRKKWIIILTIVLGVSILAIGCRIGWMIGKRKNASESYLNNTDSLIDSATTATTEDGTSLPSKAQMTSPTKLPSETPTRLVATQQPVPVIAPIRYPIKEPVPVRTPVNPPVSPPVRTPLSPPVSPPVRIPSRIPVPVNIPEDDESEIKVTYIPGNLTRMQNDLLLSEGLQARIIARSGQPVAYEYGSASEAKFHILPDAGATFPDTRWWNAGGWIYVSNSEAKNVSDGGVGAITFDKNGFVTNYRMVLEESYMNCGGGRTPWNTWVSCEEVEFTGQMYQVDPTGQRSPEVMTMGLDGGRWESFAYDVRNKNKPRFFATEDHNKGTTRRFTPSVTHWGGDEWKMLHEQGVLDYLFIIPNEERTGGTFKWIDDLKAAKDNAKSFYPQSEGIDIQDGIMYIVCKKIQQLFVFDLDKMTFTNVTTTLGLFDGDPDQIQRIVGEEGGLLYFTEEGGKDAGVHARDHYGRFFTILESPVWADETSGLSFSPDGKHLYVAYQENGTLYDVTREDGLAFNAKSLDVKYHNSISSRRLNSQWIGH